MHVVPEILSRTQLKHRLRSEQHLICVLWSDEPGGFLEPAQEDRKARRKSVPIGPNPAKRKLRTSSRTSSRTRVSATGAATACEPELLTIHITDNHTKSQSSRSSWRTTASRRVHLAVNC